jgi:hypothetical protein
VRRSDYILVGIFILVFVAAASTVGRRGNEHRNVLPPELVFDEQPVGELRDDSLRTVVVPRGERGYPWDLIIVHQGVCPQLISRDPTECRFHLVIGGGHGVPDGEVQSTVAWESQLPGAHTGDPLLDRRAIAVVLPGDLASTPPTARQLETLEALVRQLREHYNIPAQHLLGHDELPGGPPGCPGAGSLRRLLAQLRGS